MVGCLCGGGFVCSDLGGDASMIYHGTPMTPRAALVSVCTGRGMCVSFYRPDDVEAVQEIAPFRDVRQRGVFILEAGTARRDGMGGASRLDSLFRVAGAAPVSSGPVGSHPRYAGGTIPAQRRTAERLAVRAEGCAPLAHGRADRTPVAPVRAIRPGLPRMDRSGEGDRLPRVSGTHGRGGAGARQSLAGSAHDARHGGLSRLPVRQRGQHQPRAERVAV